MTGPGSGATVPLAGTLTVDRELQGSLRSALLQAMVSSRATLAVVGAGAAALFVGVDLIGHSVVVAVVMLLVVAAAIVTVARSTTRSRVVHGYPVGSVVGVGLGERVLRLDTGDLVEELDHSLFVGLDAGRDVVRLRFRVGGVALVPRSLLPDEAMHRLQAGAGSLLTGDGLLAAKSRLPWSHTVTAVDRQARRGRVLRAIHRARRTTYVLIVVVAALIALPTSSWLPFLLVLLIPLQEVQDRLRVARSDALVFGEGVSLRAGIEDDRLVVCAPTALSSRPLSRLTEVIALPDLVVLRWDLPLFETQYPPGLFPADALERLKRAAGPP